MLGGIAKALFGSSNDRYVKSLDPLVKKIAGYEPAMEAMSDDELAGQTAKFRARLAARCEPIPTSRLASRPNGARTTWRHTTR